MIEKIKKLLGLDELPPEVTLLYRGARSEREAVILLKEARRRDEARRRRSMEDLEVLVLREEELLEEGKKELSESRRLMLARRIKEIRWKQQEFNNRIENIYNKRLKVYNEHLKSLETILELSMEELPDKKTMEDMTIKAKQLLEELDKTKELAEGMALTAEPASADTEEREILKEFETRRDREIETEPKKESKEKPPEIQFEE